MGSKWNAENRQQKLEYDRQFTKQYNQEHQEERTAYRKQWYQNNAASIKARSIQRQKEIRDFIRQQKVGLSCKRCGITDLRVLDFHHIDKDEKEISLPRASYYGWSNERILQEIAKCEVLCANCHRILHWEEWEAGLEQCLRESTGA